MMLFMVFSIPLFTLLVLSIYRWQWMDGGTLFSALRGALSNSFIKGVFCCVLALIVILLLRRFVPLSFRPFKLFFILTLRDHLLPLFILLGVCFLTLQEKSFFEIIFFASGFYSLLSLTEVFLNYGKYDPYNLFLLPAMRMSMVLYFTLLFIRFREWYGFYKILFLIIIILIPLTAGAITYFYMRFHIKSAVMAASIFYAGSIVFLLLEGRNINPGRAAHL